MTTKDIPFTPVRRTPWPDSVSTPVATPLQPSVVYASADPDTLDDQYEGRAKGYTYAREGHPNADVLAAKLDAMEGVEGGMVMGSGMAAVTAALFGLTKAGDHVLGSDQLYGRSLRILREDLPRFGVETSLADPTDLQAMRAAVRPNTRAILIEVVSNPTLRVADVAGIRKLAKEIGADLIIDNTFTTPRAVRAVDLGADVVIQSITKLLAGHSDVTLGYVGATDRAKMQAIRNVAVTFGLTPSPFDCWLAERGIFTFDLRYDRAEATAGQLANLLSNAAPVSRVLYPGREDHPDHELASALLGNRTGNMVSFELKGGRAAANAFTRAASELPFAPTLGDVATTLSHPATSSHRALSEEEHKAMGIGQGFFRVSVGIEEPEYLLTVFRRALSQLG